MARREVGRWRQHFSGEVEYVPELKLWFGLFRSPCLVCRQGRLLNEPAKPPRKKKLTNVAQLQISAGPILAGLSKPADKTKNPQDLKKKLRLLPLCYYKLLK